MKVAGGGPSVHACAVFFRAKSRDGDRDPHHPIYKSRHSVWWPRVKIFTWPPHARGHTRYALCTHTIRIHTFNTTTTRHHDSRRALCAQCGGVWTVPVCTASPCQYPVRSRPAGCTGCRPGVDRLIAPCRRTSIDSSTRWGLFLSPAGAEPADDSTHASFWRSEHACQRPTGGFSSSRHARQSCRCGFEAWGPSLDGFRRGRDNRRANAITSLRSVCPAGPMPALTAQVLCLGRATRRRTPRPSSEKTTPRNLNRNTAEPDRPSKPSRP